MPATKQLLERAYQLINANQIQDAEFVLDAVVRVDPQNAEAWRTYLMIRQSQNGLDWVKERILKTKELSASDKTKLINYHLHLSKQLNGAAETAVRREPFAFLVQEERELIVAFEKTAPQFELIDMYDYPARTVRNETRARPRRRAIYNPFAFDLTRILKAMSQSPVGRKVANQIQEMSRLANEFVKNPRDAFAKLSNMPHFEQYTEVGLLVLFVLGVRLAISSHILGYLFLGMFVYGGRWWLIKFGNRSTTALGNQVRVYQQENKVNLPEIKEIDHEQKLEKENTGKTIK
jgi:hypothetical protein